MLFQVVNSLTINWSLRTNTLMTMNRKIILLNMAKGLGWGHQIVTGIKSFLVYTELFIDEMSGTSFRMTYGWG